MTDADADEEFAHSHPVTVRTGDIDANGHVNNTVYSEYLQEGRAGYLREVAGAAFEGVHIVIATLDIEFRRPILLDDEVFVDVRVTDLGETSFTMEYRVRADGEVAATAESVQVAWDADDAEPLPIPDGWRERIHAAEDGLPA